jgi:tetratricopeptide (TPR) repeat protein
VRARPGDSARAAARTAYERGLRIWRTRTGLAGAIAEYRRAIAVDPGFALAHVALADAYAVQVSPSPEAERELAEALRLAPDLGEAQASLGFIRMFHYWDWAGAEAALRRAVVLAPGYAQAHHWLGCCLMLQRRFDQSRASLEQAERLDPGSPSILLDLGLLAYYTGDDGAAVRYCEAARSAEDESAHPAHECLVRVYERTGRFREAWELDQWMLGRARPDRGGYAQRLREAPQVWIGKTLPYAEGEMVGAELVNPNVAYKAAVAFARLGDRKSVLRWLDTGIGRRAFLMPYVNVDPVFDAYRGDAGFRRVLGLMGFPAP